MVLGQCTELLQSKLKQQANWATVNADQDGIELIKMIKKCVHKFEDQKYLPLALINAKMSLYIFRQGTLSNDEYYKKFCSLVDIARSYNGVLYDNAIRAAVTERDHSGTDFAALTNAQKATVLESCHQVVCATLFINGADKTTYNVRFKILWRTNF